MYLKFLLSVFLMLSMTGCMTQFVDHSSEPYARLSCEINPDADPCAIIYGKNGEEGFIEYKVTQAGDNRYLVNGTVDIDLNIVGAMNPDIIFYFLFMDDAKVVAERKVRTATKKATFEFELEMPEGKAATKTVIAKPVFKYWS